MSHNTFSLYIHVPFCDSVKCGYCDFYSVPSCNESPGIMDAFIKALIKDINCQIEYFNAEEIKTVYIGGGTPSVLGAKRLAVLLDALKLLPDFNPVEFTIELNPESASDDVLSVCKDSCVNRISAGVQTFHEKSRIAAGRSGLTSDLMKQLERIVKIYPDNFNADLITGLPFQNKEIILDDIKKILSFSPAHISLYSLIIENDTVLEKNIKNGKLKLPENEEADSLWLSGKETLLNAGFENYEVSNFSLKGKRCLHNIRYWQIENWIGAGPSASGTIINEDAGTARRYTFESNLKKYLENPSIHAALYEELNSVNLIKESILMGYRYCNGPSKAKFRSRFGIGIEDIIGQTLKNWENRDIMLFLNRFLCEAFSEIDSKLKIGSLFPIAKNVKIL